MKTLRVLLAGWCVGGFLSCGPNDEGQPQPSPPVVQAKVVQVQSVEIPVQVELTGLVVAKTDATLSSKIRGIVQEVRVREGHSVVKGQPLVVFESQDLRAQLANAKAEFENAQITLQRMERLFKEDSVAKHELDDARRAFKVTKARTQVAAVQLGYSVIRAPFAGLITERLIEPGEFAAPGHPLLKIEDPAHLRLEVTVPEQDLSRFALGDSVSVIIDALRRQEGVSPLAGTVAQVVPTGDPSTHTFLLKIDLPPTPGLRSGMFGRAVYIKGQTLSTVVPETSLMTRNGLTGVFVVHDDQLARLRWVKAGRRLDEYFSFPAREILSGLHAGELVLANAEVGIEGARIQKPKPKTKMGK